MWPFRKREPKPLPTYILSGNQYVMRPDLAAKYFPPVVATKPPRPAGRGGYPASSKPMSEAKPPPASISKPTNPVTCGHRGPDVIQATAPPFLLCPECRQPPHNQEQRHGAPEPPVSARTPDDVLCVAEPLSEPAQPPTGAAGASQRHCCCCHGAR